MNLGYIDTILAFTAVMAGLSLVVTALTQAFSAVCGLRGQNLKWGLAGLLGTLAPRFGTGQQDAIAQAILQHPLLSDSSLFWVGKRCGWLRNASHIRKEELIRLLAQWRAALELPQTNDGEKAARARALEAGNVPAAIRKLGADASTQLRSLEGDLAVWFDSCMDRVSQRFLVHMRATTVVGAILVTLALLFDSTEVWRRLASDADLRARIIASAETLRQKADEMSVGTTNLPPAVFFRAVEQLIKAHPGVLAPQPAPTEIANLASGLAWIKTHVVAGGVTNQARLLAEYQALVPQTAVLNALQNLEQRLSEQLLLGLFQPSYPRGWAGWRDELGRRWLGLALSVVLLSLGAPFWFNLLRSMSNLRPVLAQKDAPKGAE